MDKYLSFFATRLSGATATTYQSDTEQERATLLCAEHEMCCFFVLMPDLSPASGKCADPGGYLQPYPNTNQTISFTMPSTSGGEAITSGIHTITVDEDKTNFIIQAGLFNPNLPCEQDMELSFRLRDQGMKLIYCREAYGIHMFSLLSSFSITK